MSRWVQRQIFFFSSLWDKMWVFIDMMRLLGASDKACGQLHFSGFEINVLSWWKWKVFIHPQICRQKTSIWSQRWRFWRKARWLKQKKCTMSGWPWINFWSNNKRTVRKALCPSAFCVNTSSLHQFFFSSCVFQKKEVTEWLSLFLKKITTTMGCRNVHNILLSATFASISVGTLFLATLSSSISISNGDVIPWDTAPINPGGYFDTTSGTYTVPMNGYYQWVNIVNLWDSGGCISVNNHCVIDWFKIECLLFIFAMYLRGIPLVQTEYTNLILCCGRPKNASIADSDIPKNWLLLCLFSRSHQPGFLFP